MDKIKKEEIKCFSDECSGEVSDFCFSELKKVGFTYDQSVVISSLLGAVMTSAASKAVTVVRDNDDCESCKNAQKKNKV